jgi:hypothetical protein
MGDSSLNFNGPLNFEGGIQNFGGQNTNTQQNNYLDPGALQRIETELAALRESVPDRDLADREITAIREGLRQPSPENRKRVDAALQRLSANAGNTRTAAEALAAIGALLTAHWPF